MVALIIGIIGGLMIGYALSELNSWQLKIVAWLGLVLALVSQNM